MALIIIGGSTGKTFFQVVCGATCSAKPLTTVEWYLVFTCAAVVLSQLPNLNSIAGLSLVGAVTAVGYCTMMWVVSVAEGRLPGVSYNPVRGHTQVVRIFNVLNALGIIAFAFRGHNLILEIQVYGSSLLNECYYYVLLTKYLVATNSILKRPIPSLNSLFSTYLGF